jgi:hypothetical protein
MPSQEQSLIALLNERDVARITGLSIATVRRWRLVGQGPGYLKIGASVRYHPDDVRVWLDVQPRGGSPSGGCK